MRLLLFFFHSLMKLSILTQRSRLDILLKQLSGWGRFMLAANVNRPNFDPSFLKF